MENTELCMTKNRKTISYHKDAKKKKKIGNYKASGEQRFSAFAALRPQHMQMYFEFFTRAFILSVVP